MAFAKTLLAGAVLAASANAHCLITKPVPFDQASLNNSPLNNDASDFPCKFASGVYDATVTTMNQIKVGESNELVIEGGATHGGGSCQISVTLDKTPTKSSQWKVIKSIIGGCPNSNPGNVADVATYAGNPPINYTLAEGMPNGQYTLAWSWLNKIGNREFYMNCAPIEVSGGADDNKVYDSLPDMFVANLPRESCATPETFNWDYPDPGQDVETLEASPLASTFSISTGCAAVTALGAGSGSAGTPASATAVASSAAGSSAATSSADAGMIGSSAAATSSNSGGVFAPGASSSAAVTSAAAATTMATSAAAATSAAPAATSAASGSSGSSSSGSCTDGQVACSTEGFYCLSATQFAMCANGCATPMDVADGTACTAGKIDFATPQKPAGTKQKRKPHPHAHMHRRNAFGYDF